jgi:hypothetical protein
MTHTLTNTTTRSRHYTSYTPVSRTHNPSHVIKAGLISLNASNIYIQRPFNNVTTIAAW